MPVETPHLTLSTNDRPHRYRIHFADGSVGSRSFPEPVRVGQLIAGSHVVSEIERQPVDGSIGRVRAKEAPEARFSTAA